MNHQPEDWNATDWDDAELETLRAGAKLTFREKLQWLERSDHLGRHLQTCRVRYPDPENPGNWILAERPNNPDPQ